MKTTTLYAPATASKEELRALKYEDKKFIFIVDHKYDDPSNRLYIFCQKGPHSTHRLPLWLIIE